MIFAALRGVLCRLDQIQMIYKGDKFKICCQRISLSKSYLRDKFENYLQQQVKHLYQAYEVSLLLFFSSTNIMTPNHEIEKINHHLLLPFISSAQAEIGIIAKHQIVNSNIVREISLGITIIPTPARIPLRIPTNNEKLITEPNDKSNK